MTWKEFKEKAESEGITDNMQIWLIEVFLPQSGSNLSVNIHDEGDEKNFGLWITD